MVSVLSILALLLILVLSISAVMHVETRTSATAKNLLVARNNAIIGLQTAMSQLQDYAGKDQAVTFPATTFFPTKDMNLPMAASPRQGLGDLFDNSTYGYRKFATRSDSRSYLDKVGTYLVPSERIAWDNALNAYWNGNRNPRWTGIMDSALRVDRATNPNGDPAPLPAQRYESDPGTKFGEPKRDQLPVWLVSGNERFTINQETDTAYPEGYYTPDVDITTQVANDPNLSIPSGKTAADYIVTLVGEGSSTNSTLSADGMDGRVRVKKQELLVKDSAGANQTTGHFAYWVGDESTKANFAVRDPYFTAAEGTVDYLNRLQAPQRVGWENISGFDLATFDINDARLENISTSKEIGLLEESKTQEIKDAARKNFHNLTAFSRSLPTDTALGGLKKDLTAYLERNQGMSNSDPIADPNLYETADARFRAWGGTNTGFPNSSSAALDGIPTWGQIKSWYEASGSSGAVTPTADTAPVLTYIMFHSGMSYDPATKRVRWHWLPAVVLWNPYNVPLASATYDLEVGLSPWIWQMLFVKENPTLAELQQDVDAQWQGTEGDRSTYTFLDSVTNTRLPLITANPDSVNMTNGPWPLDNNLTDGTTDAFGRFYYYGTKADSSMYQGYQGVGGAGNLSALGNKAFPIRIAPHDGPVSSSTSSALPVDRPLQFRVSGAFGPGEALVFTVPNDVEWTPGTPVTLTNQFQPDAPASLWFDLLTLANGPASATAEGVKWYYSQIAETISSPTVRLSIGGKIILESKTPLGAVAYNKTTINAAGRDLFYYFDYGGGGALSRSESDDDGDGRVNREEPMPSFVHAWRPLYNFSDFADRALTQDTKNTASSIYGYGETFVRPILPITDFLVGGGVTNEENHACLPVFSRFNLGAKSVADHPMVDWMRDFYGANNRNYAGATEGLTKFSLIKSIDADQSKWDDNQADGNLGFALIMERDFRQHVSSADYSYNQYKPLSRLAIRNAMRAESEILSLGQFQQANLSPYFWQPSFPIGNSDAGVYNDREAIAGIHSRIVGGQPHRSIAVKPNNAARTDTFSDGVSVDVPGNSMMDMSYLLNENLWDRYFLSSITGSPDLASPLPNSRLRFTPDAATAGSALTNFDTAAAYIENVGALNVNSTSVEAWKSLLTAFRDLKLQSQSNSENPAETVPVSRSLSPIDDRVDFTPGNRVAADYGNVTGVGSKDYTKVVSGFRYLDDTMIQTLAERIVDEVRLRGPFLSLADFVNRRLVAPQGSGVVGSDWHQARTSGIVGDEGDPNTSTDFMNPSYDPFIGLQGINGAIQRAINLSGINGGLNHPSLGADGTTAGDPNDRIFSIRIKNAGTEDYEPTGWHSAHTASGIGGAANTAGKHSTEPTMRSHIDSEHLAGAAAGEAGQLFQGAPGFVTQGDLLAMIGPALTARGDTFLVRAYGDAVDKSGRVLARSYLEAVVQREPEPVKPAGASGADQWRPTDKFGRKFKIVNLRWLSPEEI